jgi:uncharacterized protein RhaS with RHS repeats
MKLHLMTKAEIPALGLITWLLVPQTAHCFYNPSTGRWLSRDPIYEAGGLNLCSFVGNTPTTTIDPHGLIQWQSPTYVDGPKPLGPGLERIQVNDYFLQTDNGRPILAWKPVAGRTYDCHGLTFDGVTAPGGPYSLYGDYGVVRVLQDEWVPICCARAGHKEGEPASGVAVFLRGGSYTHSGKVATVVLSEGRFDESASALYSKWGVESTRPNFRTFKMNAAQYGMYKCYVRKGDPRLAETTCCGRGEHEIPQ